MHACMHTHIHTQTSLPMWGCCAAAKAYCCCWAAVNCCTARALFLWNSCKRNNDRWAVLSCRLSWISERADDNAFECACVFLPAAGWCSQIIPRWAQSPSASGSCSQTEAAPSRTPWGPWWRHLAPHQRSPLGVWGLRHLPGVSALQLLHHQDPPAGHPQAQRPACCLGNDCGNSKRWGVRTFTNLPGQVTGTLGL